MFEIRDGSDASVAPAWDAPSPSAGGGATMDLFALLKEFPLQRRQLQPRQYAFRAGQANPVLLLVHAGCVMTSVVSDDGREKITGFRMRGDLLGIDALGERTHTCDAIALDTSEVWELPLASLAARFPEFQGRLTMLLAAEIRSDWSWMLALGTLGAEQRVTAFLLDFSARLERLGFSPRDMTLRMTRAQIGNFLSLQLATVTRCLSRLHAQDLIAVERRHIRILDAAALRRRMVAAHAA
jgi:CRP/FNR family transcriptional regulator, anaerobic regulatory protein